MSQIPLEPIAIDLDGPIFAAIASWPFEEEFVLRILMEDIPQRVKFESAQIWAYRDPQNTVVGFGSLSLCSDYSDLSDKKRHAYVPLLGVHPDKRGHGHGKTILNHLVEQATSLAVSSSDRANDVISEFLFLDVYEDSVNAINLYKKSGFSTLGALAFPDSRNGKNFYVMAKRISS
jgi:ribosomal protein S18 acetylase RimI-like enzyme